MTPKRKQLTLFIKEADSKLIESVRQKFNPKQYELIKSHVTLCREDELIPLEKVIDNLSKLNLSSIAVQFGEAIRFSNGKGVLLPSVGENESFQLLRKNILSVVHKNPRIHQPHITLMHPRNSTCTDAIFKEIEKVKFPCELKFRTVSLIEQEMGKEWKVLRRFELNE